MQDTPAFRNICASTRGFNIRGKAKWGGKPYPGIVVASADFLYFAVNESLIVNAVAAVGGAVGGLIGGLVRSNRPGADPSRILPQPIESVEAKNLTELPRAVLQHRDWPVNWKSGPVIVVPKRSVKSLRTTFWLGGIEIQLDGASIRVFTPIFQRRQMAEYLKALGWDVQMQ